MPPVALAYLNITPLFPHTQTQFDKDDALAVEFVAAASNLRAACYGIPVQSLFDAKVCG